MTAATLQRCTYCRMVRDLEKFSHDRSRPSGHKHICRDCDNARQAGRYRRQRRETVRKSRAKAEAFNPQAVRPCGCEVPMVLEDELGRRCLRCSRSVS